MVSAWKRVDSVLCCRAGELIVIGYDARSVTTKLTNQFVGVSNTTLLMIGHQSSVRHSVGVLVGFIVGLSKSPTTVTNVLRTTELLVWRPVISNIYQLVCQTKVILPPDTSYPAHEVRGTPYEGRVMGHGKSNNLIP